MTFPRRDDLHELMDEPGVDPREQRDALRFLRWINTWSLSRWMLGREVRRLAGPGARVLDVATGGGDIPQYLLDRGIARWAVGLDFSGQALASAQVLSPGVTYVRGDALRLPFADGAFDMATCHLFCHHLDAQQCAGLFRELDRVARRWVALDLERSRLLLGLVMFLTRLGGNRLTRNDGPVSVRRAYRSEEIAEIAKRSEAGRARVRKAWLRWLMAGGSARVASKVEGQGR